MLALVLVAAGLAAARPARADVTVDAQLSRRAVPLGESATLIVTVHGAMTGVSDPEFDAPQNLDVMAAGRSQSFSWVNGKSASEVTFRFELVPRAAATFTL